MTLWARRRRFGRREERFESMTDITTTTGDSDPSSGFDVRLVGQRDTLSVTVRRQDGSADGDIVCDLTISRVVRRDMSACPVAFRVVAPTHEEVAKEAIDLVIGEGHRIRNLTRFRYDLESSVRLVDIAIRKTESQVDQTPKEAVLSISVQQIEQMAEELPIDITTHVERMMLDTFKAAVRNIIGAAYDAGYRDGLAEVARRDDEEDLFDYGRALSDMELADIF